MTLLAIFLALIFLHSLVSARLARTVVTTPILFTLAGMLSLLLLPGLPKGKANQELFLQLAEIGLVLLLFTDASRTDLRTLKRIRNLPTRLLSVGMLLSILLGTVAAALLFPKLGLLKAAILAVILAPTDAGLGQVIVSSPRVPLKIREALNVEAGLNDGLSVPFLLFFIGLLEEEATGNRVGLLQFLWEQLGLGTLVGLGIGLVGGWLLGMAKRRDWIAHSWQQLGLVALPLLGLLAAEAVEASMFIAAFVSGLAVQVGFKQAGKHSIEFTEDWGQLLNLSVFFLFGMLVTRAWTQFTWTHALYGLLSLTVVRMVPVALSLIGTHLSRATVLFLGWFGPRGLASIVLGLVYLERQPHQPNTDGTIQLAVMATVLLSVFAHGLSALPGINSYARKIAALPPEAPERAEAELAGHS